MNLKWKVKRLSTSVFKKSGKRDPLVRVKERQGRQEFFYNAFRALSFNGIDGDYAEFGCCGGKTFAFAYHEAIRHKHEAKLWAFDSFAGLPAPKEAKDSHPKWVEKKLSTPLDKFHKLCAANGVPRDSYTVVPGFYDQTLPAMKNKDAPSNIALAYIDCDLYSSTKDVLQFLMPRLKHGMIIAFDDYYCWSSTQISGERIAMIEFFSNNSQWELVRFMRIGWHGLSYIVEDKNLTRHISN